MNVSRDLKGGTMLFQIRNRWTNVVMFEVEAKTMRAALERKAAEGADLGGADLWGADLRGADLFPAKTKLSELLRINSVIALLSSIDWKKLPDELTLEMMRHDAESCGQPLMTAWAKGGDCPFSCGVRDYLFSENQELWKPGKPKLRGKALLEALWTSKGGEL